MDGFSLLWCMMNEMMDGLVRVRVGCFLFLSLSDTLDFYYYYERGIMQVGRESSNTKALRIAYAFSSFMS